MDDRYPETTAIWTYSPSMQGPPTPARPSGEMVSLRARPNAPWECATRPSPVTRARCKTGCARALPRFCSRGGAGAPPPGRCVRPGGGSGKWGLLLASGMITSNVGLFELAHLPVPAGLKELAAGMQQALLPQVCARPIWFVPGVRNPVADIGLHDCEAMDMMRGEEAETMGLIERLKIAAPALIVLPGSHTKFVLLDAQQRIANCVTTLSGELLQVITHDTIVADSLGSDFADRIEPEMLFAGARSARSLGLGRACFMVRNLGQFTRHDRNARANFLLGAVLGADLLTLEHSSALRLRPETRCIVAGKPTLRQA